MMKKIFYGIAWLILISLIVLMSYNYYERFKPIRTVEIESIVNLTPIVKAGEDFSYYIKYCRYWEGDIEVFRSFIPSDPSGSVINLPVVQSVTSIGCRQTDVHVNVPDYAKPGKYKMVTIAKVQVSESRLERVLYETPEFEVR